MADAVEAAPPPPPEHGAGESPAASPEFEFWMAGKNTSSFPSPALLTAAELFSGGVVLPLHSLQASPADEEEVAALPAEPLPESGIAPTPDLPAVTFKWKDIFKPSNGGAGGEAKERKKAERRVSGNADLININIWPFARSRSAGHSAAVALSKAKPNPTTATTNSASPAPAARKVSSAPCSRSSSRGESPPTEPPAHPAAAAAVVPAPAPGHASMLRRLVPGRGRNNTGAGSGIRLGRPSPVWQLRRSKLQQAATEQKQQAASEQKAASPAAGDTGSDDDKASVSAANGCRNDGEEGPDPPQGRLGLRTLFSKKVY